MKQLKGEAEAAEEDAKSLHAQIQQYDVLIETAQKTLKVRETSFYHQLVRMKGVAFWQFLFLFCVVFPGNVADIFFEFQKNVLEPRSTLTGSLGGSTARFAGHILLAAKMHFNVRSAS